MSQRASRLITDCLIATGATEEQATAAAVSVLSLAVRHGLISRDHLDTWERDRHIYELRTAPAPHNLSIEALSDRFGCSVSQIKRVIRAQMLLRRSIA